MNGDLFGLFIVAFILSLGWHAASVVINNIIGHTNLFMVRRQYRMAEEARRAAIAANQPVPPSKPPLVIYHPPQPGVN
jgi:uncharacterized membrane protein